jgi:hypothetical protein
LNAQIIVSLFWFIADWLLLPQAVYAPADDDGELLASAAVDAVVGI